MFAHTIGWLLKLNQYRVVEIWVGREYCNSIVTRVGVYDGILPGPKENHEGGARGISRGLRQYLVVYPDLSHNTVILNNLY